LIRTRTVSALAVLVPVAASKGVAPVQYVSVPVCQKHGEFPITPLNHWRGQSCRKCARLSQRTSNKLVKVPAALA
jgi:hypothetical protein